VNEMHSSDSTGRGNAPAAAGRTSTERRRTSTLAKELRPYAFGRGGAGNIEAAKLWKKKVEEKEAQKEALRAEEAKTQARAAVAAIQVPKPTWSSP
jgi:hypothetical protein